MRKFLLLVFSAVGAALAVPTAQNLLIVIDPTIYFYSDGSAPISARGFPLTQEISVKLYDSLGQANDRSRAIDTLVLRGDSLFIYLYGSSSTVRPNPYAPTITFNNPGLYRAFEAKKSSTSSAYTYTSIKPLGSFRIYPVYSTTPARPLPSDSVSIRLTMGMSHSACPPINVGRFEIIGKNIHLRWDTILSDCISTAYVDPPTPYGPSYKIGRLGQGRYALFMEDSIFLDSLTISEATVLTGHVVAMQSPIIMAPTRSIAGVRITAFSNPDCSWFAGTTDTLRTITDQSGSFSLPIAVNAWKYKVTASKVEEGYLGQSIYYESISSKPTDPLFFELVSQTGGMEPKADLSIRVKDGGAPVESVHVIVYEGQRPVFCVAKPSAKAASWERSFYGTTDKSGLVTLSSLPLSPFIDYEYRIYKSFPGSSTRSASGKIRLNLYAPNELTVDFATPTPAIRSAYTPQIAKNMISTKLISSGLRVQWLGQGRPGKISVHDIQGRVMGRTNEIGANSVTFGAQTWANGIYLVRVKSENGIQTKRIQITR